MTPVRACAIAACVLAASCSESKPENPADAVTEITISCGAVGMELDLCKHGAEAWAKAENAAGRKVAAKVVSTPASSTDRLALYQQLLAAQSSDIDVFQIDVIWPGTLAPHFIDLGPELVEASKIHFPAIVENNTVGGKLIAMPWFTDAGVLFYRKDLLDEHSLPVPKTWNELTETAKKVQEAERAAGNSKMWGYVWQGRAYEGLTCNAVEWLHAEGGGPIVDRAGTPALSNRAAAEALTRAKGWIGTISPPGVLNYSEEEGRGLFQSGHAVFMRNWPYVWELANAADSPVKGKVGVVALPKGRSGRSAATLGGWQLSVSRYSSAPKAARSLVKFLTSKAEQKRRALEGGYHPTITSLYQDPALRAKNPLFEKLGTSLQDAVARPSRQSGDRYNELSTKFFNTVHGVLGGRDEAAPALQRLDSELRLLFSRK